MASLPIAILKANPYVGYLRHAPPPERDPGPSPRRRIRRNPYLGFFAHAPIATDGSWIWIDDQGNVQEEETGSRVHTSFGIVQAWDKEEN